jgi:hypothetical protein
MSTISKGKLRKLLKEFACSGNCHDIVWAISHKYPWINVDSGIYNNDRDRYADHSWNVLHDKTIVDATYSQFSSRIRIGIWSIGSDEYKKYIPFSRYKKILELIKNRKLDPLMIGLKESFLPELYEEYKIS